MRCPRREPPSRAGGTRRRARGEEAPAAPSIMIPNPAFDPTHTSESSAFSPAAWRQRNLHPRCPQARNRTTAKTRLTAPVMHLTRVYRKLGVRSRAESSCGSSHGATPPPEAGTPSGASVLLRSPYRVGDYEGIPAKWDWSAAISKSALKTKLTKTDSRLIWSIVPTAPPTFPS